MSAADDEFPIERSPKPERYSSMPHKSGACVIDRARGGETFCRIEVRDLDGGDETTALARAQDIAAAFNRAAAPASQFPVQSHSMGCCSAALAGLLGLPLSSVPDFWNEHQFGDVVDWLKRRGLCLQELVGERLWDGRYLVAGTSPRGNPHFVIYEDGALLHDPHPDGSGLIEITHTWLIYPRTLERLARG